MRDTLADTMRDYLRELTEHPDRHVGGPGNRAATRMFAQRLTGLNFDVTIEPFDCVEWEYGSASLRVAGQHVPLHVGPYSLPCDLSARLVAASTVDEIESESVRGAVLLLHGEVASGQFMPRNFTFYNPESHKRVYRALDTYLPAAVIAATGTDPQLVGGQYPFPLFEDGDLDIPNAYLKDAEGEKLLRHAGEDVAVRIVSRRVPATADHVVARLHGEIPGHIVVFAHIDSRKGSPGALDNASGVAALLGIAHLLAERREEARLGPSIEIVPLNGEDNYANPGEMLWFEANRERADDIILGINVDDAGLVGDDTHVSLYDVPEELRRTALDAIARRRDFAEGPPWVQGDHAMLGILGKPAIAVASAGMGRFMAEYAHTARDTADLADPGKIAEVARFLADVVTRIGQRA